MNEISFINTPDDSHPFLVIKKSGNIPSAPLKEGDFSALTLAMEKFPEIKAVRGIKPVEYGLLHRIDNETSGLLLIALNQDFFDFMIEQQKSDFFEKSYRARVDFAEHLISDGFPDFNSELKEKAFSGNEIKIESFFRKFGEKGKSVRPVTKDSGKAALKKGGEVLYSTSVLIKETNAIATITRGFRHQVRCHLAWLGTPVKGDCLYNPLYESGQKLQFEAFRIKFNNPFTGKTEVFEV